MTKKTRGIVEKIDDRFETALRVNNSCRALGDGAKYDYHL